MKQCPFCMSEIPDGATVCASCGARKEHATERAAVIVKAGLWAVAGLAVAIWGLMMGDSSGWSLIGAGVGAYGVYIAVKASKMGETWKRKD